MRVKLKDAFNLQMGKTPSRADLSMWGGNNKWISIADIGSAKKYISSTKECITDEGVSRSGIKVVPEGTVIMSFKLSIGKTAIVSEDMYTNEAIMAFIDNGTYCIDPNYLYHLCCGTDWTQGGNKAVMGLTLNKATLSEMEIELPTIEEQREIASKLDQLDAIIEKRHDELNMIEQLVKSRFIELFGDTPDGEKVAMADICRIITDGTHQPPKFVSEGIPFLFVSNIVTNEIRYDAQKFISEETYAELIKRTPIAIGDILLSTVGSYGHPAVVKTEKPFCFQRHIAYLKPNADIVDSEYLRGAILSADVQRQIDEGVKGIAQKTLNLSEIRKIRLPLPPIELQEQFAAFVEQTDKSKLAVQKALEELEILKKSLMQQYFG